MVMINRATKEMTMKIVFYGPGLCGKTTNLEYIFEKANPEKKGKLLSVATETDRTLFFDFLPMELGTIRGMKLRVQLYTVPGQVFYDATRRIVLRGSDGVVFVADSQVAMLAANQESVENLLKNLRLNNLDPDTIPLVFQYNKQDLPDLSTMEELEEALNWRKVPSYATVATTGIGVNETLKKVIELVIRSLHQKEADLKHPAQAARPVAEPPAAAPDPPPPEPPPAEEPVELEPPPPREDVTPEPAAPPAPSQVFEFSRKGEFDVESAEEEEEPEELEIEPASEVEDPDRAHDSPMEASPVEEIDAEMEVELEEVEMEEVSLDSARDKPFDDAQDMPLDSAQDRPLDSAREAPAEVEEVPSDADDGPEYAEADILKPDEIADAEPIEDSGTMPAEAGAAVEEIVREESFDSAQDKPFGQAQDRPFDPAQDKPAAEFEPSPGSNFDKILASYQTEIDGALSRLQSLVSDFEDLKRRIGNLEDRLKP